MAWKMVMLICAMLTEDKLECNMIELPELRSEQECLEIASRTAVLEMKLNPGQSIMYDCIPEFGA